MRACKPHVVVAGDNNSFKTLPNGTELRPHIMARSGDCLGMNDLHAVWRFGFSKGSEAAGAYGISLDIEGFLWVLATRKTGKVKECWHGIAINMPDHFREVIDG